MVANVCSSFHTPLPGCPLCPLCPLQRLCNGPLPHLPLCTAFTVNNSTHLLKVSIALSAVGLCRPPDWPTC